MGLWSKEEPYDRNQYPMVEQNRDLSNNVIAYNPHLQKKVIAFVNLFVSGSQVLHKY